MHCRTIDKLLCRWDVIKPVWRRNVVMLVQIGNNHWSRWSRTRRRIRPLKWWRNHNECNTGKDIYNATQNCVTLSNKNCFEWVKPMFFGNKELKCKLSWCTKEYWSAKCWVNKMHKTFLLVKMHTFLFAKYIPFSVLHS